MTLAVCLQCGSMKVGALTPCPGCGYDPSGDDVAIAKALLLSDQHASPASLEAASQRIKAGEPPELDKDQSAQLATGLPRDLPASPVGCRVAVWTPVMVMVLLGLFVAYLYGVLLR